MIILFFFFFFNDTATTEIYTLSLTTLFRSSRGCIPITSSSASGDAADPTWDTSKSSDAEVSSWRRSIASPNRDRKSTRLNSSHSQISYAVFCLKKKKKKKNKHIQNVKYRLT